MGVQRFRAYFPDQDFLLPPTIREWVPEDHLANFINETIDALDLSPILDDYDNSDGGQAPFHPVMMTKLLVYAYCVGVMSSRKIELNTYEVVPFRMLSVDQHPDHDTINEFRKRHLAAFGSIFLIVLQLAQKVGLVKLGHVALDGTKLKANASKHKAMSYAHMTKKMQQLRDEIKQLLDEAEAVDQAEDKRYGKGKRGDELPAELRFRKLRLKKILEAKQALEAEARAQARLAAQAKGKVADVTDVQPKPKAQYNFTDSDSRIMKDGATQAIVQAFNGQVAVDAEHQIIVAAAVTQEGNDKHQVEPMVERIKANLGELPKVMTMDNGYYTDENVKYLEGKGIDGYIATGRVKHGEAIPAAPRGRIPKGLTIRERMTRKLRTMKGRATYAKRQEIAEPVIGQIKQVRGFRQFLLRRLTKVPREFDLVCLTHNLLKIFRYSWKPALA